jgi:hypothetical protein
MAYCGPPSHKDVQRLPQNRFGGSGKPSRDSVAVIEVIELSGIEVSVGDVAVMRKAHPCGGFEWVVTRTGADIGLKCLTCGRRVMLDRETFERRLREIRRPTPSE